ncbi:MAG TPA: STAS domain-containing protein [Streptosporangiaceae bacterium]|nr:STAS domain-containing protein [Streptosporangiaceae bacterium]
MTDGQYHIELVSGIPVVTVPEEIDVTNAADLRAALLKAGVNGSGTLVADMTQTQFCDSSGVHALVAAHRRAQAEGGQLLLVISSAAVLRILAITGIDRVIPNFTSVADALAHATAHADNGQAHTASNLVSNPDADPGRAPVA